MSTFHSYAIYKYQNQLPCFLKISYGNKKVMMQPHFDKKYGQ